MLRFVYGSSELNLLRLPFFRNGKDPLEDFDYNDPRCNPILRPEPESWDLPADAPLGPAGLPEDPEKANIDQRRPKKENKTRSNLHVGYQESSVRQISHPSQCSGIQARPLSRPPLRSNNVGRFRRDNSAGRSQYHTEVHVQQLTHENTTPTALDDHLTEAARTIIATTQSCLRTKELLARHHEDNQKLQLLRSPSTRQIQSPNGINRKILRRRAQRHQSCSK
ncbi:hypothetical protein F511_05534 [Dorcoceras hygrometricum]|uniref:Uncharacterized protein n=1 Tax=Dorcoceras hygrometricum TaxID=472368 RepID=A0A2Z7B709_9LAMI|nr:hypothetical protein F511_05534 [Dorcoceras hygrometricum]